MLTYTPEQRLARDRNKRHLRRSIVRFTDLTHRDEINLRTEAHTCPLCDVTLTNDGGQGNSKNLDHIIPLCIGGTHTRTNVRITCRTCNMRRPKDGSDLDAYIVLTPKQLGLKERARKIKGHPHGPFRSDHIKARAIAAGRMRIDGHTWQSICDEIGWKTEAGAYLAVQAHAPHALALSSRSQARTLAKAS